MGRGRREKGGRWTSHEKKKNILNNKNRKPPFDVTLIVRKDVGICAMLISPKGGEVIRILIRIKGKKSYFNNVGIYLTKSKLNLIQIIATKSYFN